MEFIVSKLLEKDRAKRYQSAAGVISDLLRLKRQPETPALCPSDKSARRSRHIVIPVLLVVLTAAVLVLKPWTLHLSSTEEVAASENRLAIMYFENLEDPEDSQKLGEIATNLLITDLSQSGHVSVISSERLYDILKQIGREGQKRIDRDVAWQVANRAQAKWMLLGSILKTRPEIAVTTRLINVHTGQIDASQQLIGAAEDDVFSVVDKLTVQIKKDLALPEQAMTEADPAVADVTTHSPEAYLHYLEGLDYFYKLYHSQARDSFERALEFDSTFAMAYVRLAICDIFNLRAILPPESREYVLKAEVYSETISSKEKLYVNALSAMAEYDYHAAVVSLRDIAEQYPDEKEAHLLSGFIHLFRFYEPQQAIADFSAAIEIDPLYKLAFNYLAYAQGAMGDFDNAIASINEYIALAPGEPNPYDSRGDLFAFSGNIDLAIASYTKALEMNPDFGESKAKLVSMLTLKGNRTGSDSLCTDLVNSGDPVYEFSGRWGLFRNAARAGQLRLAGQLLQELLADTEYPMASWSLGLMRVHRAEVYDEREMLDSAITEARGAVTLVDSLFGMDPFFLTPTLIRLLAKSGQVENAQRQLNDYSSRIQHWSNIDSLCYLQSSGYIALYKEGAEESLSYFQRAAGKAIQLADPAAVHYRTHYMLALAYLESGACENAVAVYEELLSSSGWDRLRVPIWSAKTHYHLGVAYQMTDRYNEAIEQYETFLDLWRDADSGLAPVEDAARRLENLKDELANGEA
jgi:tetratricopeptide (TPR) repeat protein